MHWELSEEQRAYQDSLRSWLKAVAPSDVLRGWLDEGASGHREFQSRLVADGFAGVGIAEELGGQGGGLIELALTAEEMGYAAVPSAAWLASVVTLPLLSSTPDVIAGSLVDAPVVLAGPAEAIPSGAPAQVSVSRVLAADLAAFFVVPRADGSLDLVPSHGVRIRRRGLLDRTRSVADLDLAAATPIGRLCRGQWGSVAARAAVLVAADALGASQRMLEMSVEYSLQRRQFGAPIGSFQAVKHAAATMLVGIEAARSAVYYAAASVDAMAPDHLLHAAAVKSQVTAEAARAADAALTLHGAIGYTWEHDLHLYYKRAKLDEQLFGSPRVWVDDLASRLNLV